jgi:uncharacterized caspase-like protein
MLLRAIVLAGFVMLAVLAPGVAVSQPAETRVAFVVGNEGTVQAPLPTALNDAGLVAEALRSVGFDVIEGADLNQTDFFRSFRQFLARVESGGSSTIAFVYFSGYGFEFDGDNYLVMADARLERENDIALDTVRLSDLLHALANAPGQAKVMVSDASRPLPFAIADEGFPKGLAAVDAPHRMLVAFSAPPATTVEDRSRPYGAFAIAIAEMIRTPGLDLTDAFGRIRMRTHELTQARQTPWNVSSLGSPLVLLAPENGRKPATNVEPRPRNPEEAYALAIRQDTLAGYVDFISAYPRHILAARIRAILRIRREALTWLHAVKSNTAAALWTYLDRYPHGIFVANAQSRLERLAASLTPPSNFSPMELRDVPPPSPNEQAADATITTSVPLPLLLVDPQPRYLTDLMVPPPRVGAHVLPTPKLPEIGNLAAGKRLPLSSLTGLPGMAGPIATNDSQSRHVFADTAQPMAAASDPVPPVIDPPVPPPAPLRNAQREKLSAVARKNCSRRRADYCR